MVLCGILAVGSASFTETAEEVLENVRKQYDAINDARVVFTQRVRFQMANIDQRVNGSLDMKKGNKYRVELGDQTIVTNGETVWSYSAPTNQVLIDNFKVDERSFTPERVLSAAPEDFTPTLLGNEKIGDTEAIVLKLLPKDDQSFLESMKLWVDQKEWLIKKVEMVDQNGKLTEYIVKEIRINVGLQDSQFTYHIPADAEVVDLR
jgi:outer membrane lipoprotein carrier protein